MDRVQLVLLVLCLVMCTVVVGLFAAVQRALPRLDPLGPPPVPLKTQADLDPLESELTCVCISLPSRHASHYEPMRADFVREGLTLERFTGINGKELNLDEHPLTLEYRAFFENNEREFREGKTKTHYRGHLGATLSHLGVIRGAAERDGMTLIVEDDVDIHQHFRVRFQQAVQAVTELDPGWDILLLGFTAKYDDYHFHKLNDYSPVYPGGIVRVYAWIGGWAYVVRNARVAAKILRCFEPAIPWHIDLTLAQNARNGKLNVYGCMPTIADHAGQLRISTWSYTQVGKWATLKTDTNL